MGRICQEYLQLTKKRNTSRVLPKMRIGNCPMDQIRVKVQSGSRSQGQQDEEAKVELCPNPDKQLECGCLDN
jgi:hypothetical protein